MFRPQTKKVIEKEIGTSHVVDLTREGLLVSACVECNLHLTGKSTKIGFLNCSNCQIKIDCDIITGIGEIINCNDLTIILCSDLPTLQIDGSNNITFSLPEGYDKLHNIVTCNTKAVTFKIPQPGEEKTKEEDYQILKLEIPESAPKEQGEVEDQYITRFTTTTSRNSNKPPVVNLLTELGIREGVGYITTTREKDIADKRDARYEEAIDQYFKNTLKISNPNEHDKKN
eukprot:TRINITY_DN2706_c0_g1_i1.p1 TRINITY_DN2706_c0_g1~~TRINITY_DN2706_c0_g1_i1.p1  ORF type:complete len:247 (-),score=43.44 TRINITY_DN2706_c0_g1_i1:87-773(-)